jgi:hypothetical protein
MPRRAARRVPPIQSMVTSSQIRLSICHRRTRAAADSRRRLVSGCVARNAFILKISESIFITLATCATNPSYVSGQIEIIFRPLALVGSTTRKPQSLSMLIRDTHAMSLGTWEGLCPSSSPTCWARCGSRADLPSGMHSQEHGKIPNGLPKPIPPRLSFELRIIVAARHAYRRSVRITESLAKLLNGPCAVDLSHVA